MFRKTKVLIAVLVVTVAAAGVVTWQTTCCGIDAAQMTVARVEGESRPGRRHAVCA
jgi:hypothetical protein